VQEIALFSAADPAVAKLLGDGTLVLRDSVPYSVQTGKIYVPEDLRERVMRECHSTPSKKFRRAFSY
jgi:hypothetical protein